MTEPSNISDIIKDPLAPHSVFDDDDKSTYISSIPEDKLFWKQKTNILKKYKHYMDRDPRDIEKKIYPADLTRATSKMEDFLSKNKETTKMKFEDRLLETIKANRRDLHEDVKSTVEQFRKYVESIEDQAAIQEMEKKARDKDDWAEYWVKEKEYNATLKKGIEVMKKFAKAISMEPHAVDLKNHLWNFNEENIADAYMDDQIKEIESVGYALMVRFTKLLDKEGIEHSLPVPPPNYRARIVKKIVKKRKETSKDKDSPAGETKGEPVKKIEKDKKVEKVPEEKIEDSALSISSNEADNPVSPSTFLETFADRKGLTLRYADVSFKSTPFVKEYIVSCKLDTLGAEGKGRTKNIAREVAAAELIKLMLAKMKRLQIPPHIGNFSDQDKKLALTLTCEYINYEKLLNGLIARMNTTRTPQYAPIFNAPHGQFSFRCKALGYNAVGTGRTKDIAKRMGAKILMDRIEDQREKYYVNKYGEKKAKKFLKIR